MTVCFITIQGKHPCATGLVSIGEAQGSVLILQRGEFPSQARVEVVLLAAAYGVVKAQGDRAGGAPAIQDVIFFAQMVLQHIVAQGELQAVGNQRRDVGHAIVIHMAARHQPSHGKVVALFGRVQKVVVNADLTVARVSVAVVVHSNEALLALVLI